MINYFEYKSVITNQSNTILRIAVPFTAEHPLVKTAKEYAGSVERSSEGELSLDLISGNNADSMSELIEQLHFGGIALAVVSSDALCDYYPALEPLFLTNAAPQEVYEQALYDIDELEQALNAEQISIVAAFESDYGCLVTKTPVNTADDLRGLRLYNPSRRLLELGAQRSETTIDDLVQSINNSYADGGELRLLEYVYRGYYNAMPYLNLTVNSGNVYFLLASNVSLGDISFVYREYIKKASTVLREFYMSLLYGSQQAAVEKLIQNGVSIYPASITDTAAENWYECLSEDAWLTGE